METYFWEKYKLVLVALLLGILFSALAGAVYFRTRSHRVMITPVETSSQQPLIYTHEISGISFPIPEGYVLTEGEHGTGERSHYAIALVRKEDAAPRENSEGPPAITIDIYQNNIDQLGLLDWLNGSNESNYKLAHALYASTTMDGNEAVSYQWSGLYEGKTTAFIYGDYIIAISVTALTPEDKNIAVYRDLLSSIKLQHPKYLPRVEAIQLVKNIAPDLADYPSDGLPPKTIKAEMYNDGWNMGFFIEGSGRVGILGARCYQISNSKRIIKIGEYKVGIEVAPPHIDVSTCKPIFE